MLKNSSASVQRIHEHLKKNVILVDENLVSETQKLEAENNKIKRIFEPTCQIKSMFPNLIQYTIIEQIKEQNYLEL